MPLTYRPLHAAISIASIFAATFFGVDAVSAAEAVKGNGNGMTTQELERRPIPDRSGDALKSRHPTAGLLRTRAPSPRAELRLYAGGTAESAYGEDDVKRFHPGDHWSQPIDLHIGLHATPMQRYRADFWSLQ